MSESYRTEQPWSGSTNGGNGYQGYGEKGRTDDGESGEGGKILLVGVLGGLLSAAGYIIYRRLPDEQRQRIHTQVRTLVQQRITELRQNFNI
ncbi:MAG TPA: hypothetical protein VMU38_05965 [Candidatus Binatia bacterium]|nr:hypothetical protein [Candidatus Binatia bacterium]